jgi:TfoX/Sxy family transcriptional regulator of competence genes
MEDESQPGMPKWQAAPAGLVRTFDELVQPLPGVERRKMFGYPCAFFQGQMFAGLFADSMFLRLAEEDRARFLALEGAGPFTPMAGRPMREYVVIPPAMLEDPSVIAPWLDRALSYAASLPAKEPKKKRKSTPIARKT